MKKQEKMKKSKKDKKAKRKNKQSHITYEERVKIEGFLQDNYTRQKIANNLHRGKSTISEEISRNKCADGVYRAKQAKHRAYIRQHEKKKDCLKASMNIEIQNNLMEKTEKGVSPEAISKETKREDNTLKYISPKAIRKFIKKRRPNLEVYWFKNRTNVKSGPKRRKAKFLAKLNRNFIEKRDEKFGDLFNLEYGHWEGDFIVSKHNSSVLLVLVERKSKFTLIDILPNRKNIPVNKHISSLLKGFKVKSLTLDNDIAFQKWKDLEKQLNTNIYFTHPYHSWEKGLVENMNKWIREFVPKKTDIKKLRKSKIKFVQDWLNNKPRQILEGQSAYSVMYFGEKRVRISSVIPTLPVRIVG